MVNDVEDAAAVDLAGRQAAALDRVGEARLARQQVNLDERVAVDEARANSVTWREIAEALGRREPNVIRQFGASASEKTAALRQLGQLAPATGRRTKALAAAVDTARRCGATVREIAEALGWREQDVTVRFGDRPPGGGDALLRLGQIPERRANAEAALVEAVAAAREVPVSWAKIGARLGGRSRGNVIHTFQPLLDQQVVETRTVTVKPQQPRRRANLTPAARFEVTRRARAGEDVGELAAEFGLAKSTVRGLRRYGPDSPPETDAQAG